MSEYTIVNGELYHYGIKGMKWGKRKAKYENKASKKYSRVGLLQGRAEYQRAESAEIMKKHNRAADALSKQATTYEKQGGFVKAEVARRSADAIRQRGINAKANNDYWASTYEKRAQRLLTKADKYATKKEIDLGKKTVDSIINNSKKKGYENEKRSVDARREFELENKMGTENYAVYNKIRGRS